MATAGNKKKSGGTTAPVGEKRGNYRIVYLGIAAILFLGALQFLLILTLGDTSLKPLDKGKVHAISVTRVVDLGFPSLDKEAFDVYLSSLSNAIRTELGYTVAFTLRRTVLVDNFISADDMQFGSRAARNWFARYRAVDPCWQGADFGWLDLILQDARSRAVLERHYGTRGTALRERIIKDFSIRFRALAEMKDAAGRPVFTDKACFRAAAICWAWLLSSQLTSDFVVTNTPIFHPSAVTPAGAVTRGGLILSLLTGSKRPLQGVLAFSSFPVRDAGMRERVLYTLQGFARLLCRRPLSLAHEDGILYPVFGGRERQWAAGKRRYYPSDTDILKEF